MFNIPLSKTRKLTISALCIALYVAIMIYTQSFAFGQYQIRIATSLYGLGAVFPFLSIPMALANLISNTFMGGLGPMDMIGGAFVGYATCKAIILTKKRNLPNIFIALFIILIPGLVVPIWLSILLNIPYLVLVPSLVIGQILPGIVGGILVTAIEKRTVKSSHSERAALSAHK